MVLHLNENKPSIMKPIVLKDSNSDIWGEQESESDSQSLGWQNSNRETPHFDESGNWNQVNI